MNVVITASTQGGTDASTMRACVDRVVVACALHGFTIRQNAHPASSPDIPGAIVYRSRMWPASEEAPERPGTQWLQSGQYTAASLDIVREELLTDADAVVVIGGGASAENECNAAEMLGIPVFAVADAAGYAASRIGAVSVEQVLSALVALAGG